MTKIEPGQGFEASLWKFVQRYGVQIHSVELIVPRAVWWSLVVWLSAQGQGRFQRDLGSDHEKVIRLVWALTSSTRSILPQQTAETIFSLLIYKAKSTTLNLTKPTFKLERAEYLKTIFFCGQNCANLWKRKTLCCAILCCQKWHCPGVAVDHNSLPFLFLFGVCVLQEYKRKLARVSQVRKELRSRLNSLPDLSLLPSVTGTPVQLPAADLYDPANWPHPLCYMPRLSRWTQFCPIAILHLSLAPPTPPLCCAAQFLLSFAVSLTCSLSFSLSFRLFFIHLSILMSLTQSVLLPISHFLSFLSLNSASTCSLFPLSFSPSPTPHLSLSLSHALHMRGHCLPPCVTVDNSQMRNVSSCVRRYS